MTQSPIKIITKKKTIQQTTESKSTFRNKLTHQQRSLRSFKKRTHAHTDNKIIHLTRQQNTHTSNESKNGVITRTMTARDYFWHFTANDRARFQRMLEKRTLLRPPGIKNNRIRNYVEGNGRKEERFDVRAHASGTQRPLGRLANQRALPVRFWISADRQFRMFSFGN